MSNFCALAKPMHIKEKKQNGNKLLHYFAFFVMMYVPKFKVPE